MRPRRAALARRRALGSLLSLAAGGGISTCAPPGDAGSVSGTDLYVGLGRARAVVVLDSATDRERRRVSLAPLGAQNVPWRIGVGPSGGAAVVPLTGTISASEPNVGVIAGSSESKATAAPRSARNVRRATPDEADENCRLVGVGTGRPRGRPYGVLEMAETLAADGRGRAYVLIGDGGMREPSYAAVVDLRRSTTIRHLPLAPAGETVLALAGSADGERLFTSIWTWDAPGGAPGTGRLVAIDTSSGIPLAQASLAADMAVTDVTLAAPPPGAASGPRRVLYAVVADPGPSRFEDDWWQPQTRFFLTALDTTRLDPIGWWSLAERPTSVAVTPDGARAYLFSGGFGWATSLSCLDLAQGAVTHRWPLPGACMGLALSPVGKAYVADPFGNRLWRVDTEANALLNPLPLGGAPIALAVA